MIQETNFYQVISDNPWMSIGYKLTKEDLKAYSGGYDIDNYPHMFSKMYLLEDGTKMVLGDKVWRSKNYEVKSVIFNKTHIENNTPIFGTRENCEKWLEKNAENIKAELQKQTSDSSFITLKQLIDRLGSYEDLSIKDIEHSLNLSQPFVMHSPSGLGHDFEVVTCE